MRKYGWRYEYSPENSSRKEELEIGKQLVSHIIQGSKRYLPGISRDIFLGKQLSSLV
jgi:hypothetical protein